MRNQIREVLSVKKRFYIIIPILMIILVLPFSFIISYYINIQKYAHLNADGYTITDTFDVEEFKKFLAEDSLYKIKKLYSHFSQVWKDRYYVMTDQPVSIDKIYGKEFAYGYGTVDSEKLSLSYVNCCQMNGAAIKGSPMELSSGRWFIDSEYAVNDTIPVIVGSHYKEHLKIGDKISIRYLYKDFDCNVIGVLKEGSRTAKNEYSLLDDYLVIPALEDITGPENEDDYKFEQKLYMHHTNGYVYSDKSVLEEQELLDDLCKSVEIKPYVFTGIPSFVNLFDWGIAKSIRFIMITTIIVFVLLSVLLSYLSYRKSRKVVVENKKSFILAKYIESLIMVAIAGLICFLFAIIARFLEIQWWVLAAVLGFIYLTLPVISIFTKAKPDKGKIDV